MTDTPRQAESQAFATASITPHKGDHSNAGTVKTSFAGLQMTGVTVERLIRFACDGKHDIVGLPKWASRMYDVAGESGGIASQNDLRAMAARLLVDRFHFSSHREAKTEEVYRLSVRDNQRFSKTATERSLGIRLTAVHGERVQWWVYTARGVPMEEFARWLSRRALDLLVVDETGLDDRFDFTFELEEPIVRAPGWAPQKHAASLEEQLGIRLKRDSMRLETLYVDNIEKPKPNRHE